MRGASYTHTQVRTKVVGVSLTRRQVNPDTSNSHSPIQVFFPVDTITYIEKANATKSNAPQRTDTLGEHHGQRTTLG